MAERKGGLARACLIYSIKIIKMTNVQNNKKSNTIRIREQGLKEELVHA